MKVVVKNQDTLTEYSDETLRVFERALADVENSFSEVVRKELRDLLAERRLHDWETIEKVLSQQASDEH